VQADLAGRKKLSPLELSAGVVSRRAAGLIINFCQHWKKLRSLDAQHVAAAMEGGFKKSLFRSTPAVSNGYWPARRN